MEKAKKIKLYIGLFYLIFIGLFLYYFFSKFSIQELTSYDFIKNNRDLFFELKQSNLFLVVILFMLFVIVWVLAAGFISPIAIFAGFFFGKWLGAFILLLGMSIGATFLYIFANYFLKEFIKGRFLNKFKNLELKFKKSEFMYLLAYRFIGGIPFAISNVLPCIFNVKTSNFFWATLIGVIPQIFLVCALGSGLEKIIDENLEAPTLKQLIFSSDIYIPLVVFFCLVVLTIFLRKIFYKS
ncbi:VTT domain-containing protein [Pelagibacterales bacterium SAG-MED19]|nr:VTT domain-containing protein [Pelagibacterales bacterium SAG-MED19]|tara:strand:+ start:261 stop:980 length:720 start_codon:yes stop_codon:yes gene_type:complete